MVTMSHVFQAENIAWSKISQDQKDLAFFPSNIKAVISMAVPTLITTKCGAQPCWIMKDLTLMTSGDCAKTHHVTWT